MKTPPKPTEYTPVEIVHGEEETVYSDDGVDLTLIRSMLALTPTQRLRLLQNQINMINRLRRAKARD